MINAIIEYFQIKSRHYFLPGLLAVTALLINPTTGANEKPFDPASVRPVGCTEGQYNCGLKFMTAEQRQMVPMARYSGISHRGLPSKVDLSNKMPPIGNQGRLGSCVAWATGYALKSYYAKSKNSSWQFDAPSLGGKGRGVFSPKFIYNQINGGQDGGSFISSALNLFVRKGAALWVDMPYDQTDYTSQPSYAVLQKAQKYRSKSYSRINGTDINTIKTYLSKGHPVAFGMPVDGVFYGLRGNEIYDHRGGRQYGGHAMTLVGYDDSKRSKNGHVGAFKIINSWGTGWGSRGYGYISYRMWKVMRPETLVLDDGADSPDVIDVDDNKLTPPASVAASKGSYQDKIVVTYSKVSKAKLYYITRAAPAGSFQYLGYSYGNSYTDKNINQGVSYRYQVYSVTSSERSGPSKAVEGYAAKKTIGKPGQVTGLQVNYSGGKVYLNWVKTPNATSYTVVRFAEGDKSWQTKGSSSNDKYTDTSPKTRKKNYYAVRARNSRGYGSYSKVVSVNVPGIAQNTKPGTPTALKASLGSYSDRIVLQWQRISNATAYYVYRYDYATRKWTKPLRTNSNSYTDTSSVVRSGRYYAYTVVAGNSAGYSGFSRSVAGYANPYAKRSADGIKAPENVKVNLNENSRMVTVSWQKVKGAGQYYVFRKALKDKSFKFVKAVEANSYQEKFPGSEGDLFFYMVRSKSLLSESIDSEAQPVFINAPRVMARHRFGNDLGIDKFTGEWQGSTWVLGRPESIKLNISKHNDSQLKVIMSSRIKGNKTYTIPFAAGARSLASESFDLSLLPENTLSEIVFSDDKLAVTLEKQ